MHNHIFCIALIGWFATFSAAYSQKVADFDKNNDKKLDAEELRAFLVFRFLPKEGFEKADTNKDGMIDSTEREIFVRKYLGYLQQYFGGPPAYSLEQVASVYPDETDLDLFGFRIRDSYEQNTLDEKEKTFKAAKPAVLTFTRNIAGNQDVWAAKGALMRPFSAYKAKSVPPPDVMYLSTIVIAPSLTVDRTISADKTKETDALQWRLGADLETTSGWVALQDFRIFGAFATDFEWKSKVVAVEFQWEPTLGKYGSGSYWRLIKSVLDFRWRLYPHLEYGNVLDAEEKMNIKAKQTFFRLGLKASLDLRPAFAQDFVLSIQYAYLDGITGTPRASRMFDPALSYSIDPNGHIVLQAEYSFGQIPLTEENVEKVTFGVGVKF